VKKAALSPRRRQPIILSQDLYLSTVISPWGPPHTRRSRPYKIEDRRSRGFREERERTLKRIQKVKDASSNLHRFLLLTFLFLFIFERTSYFFLHVPRTTS
jgi:hypothetical protein